MPTDFDAKCKASESRQVAHRKPMGGQIAEIMDKVKHTYNAFPELRTKFFHKQCVIW